jgi:hypothetical protein
MGDLAMGRIGVAEDPTTSGRSHLLQGAFLGYRYSAEIRNRMNFRPFLRDFGSVPGSQSLIFP